MRYSWNQFHAMTFDKITLRPKKHTLLIYSSWGVMRLLRSEKKGNWNLADLRQVVFMACKGCGLTHLSLASTYGKPAIFINGGLHRIIVHRITASELGLLL
ncbi:hypothetical protein Tco_1433498 [Tanacetum coccineum]